MVQTDQRVDGYIGQAEEYARPILTHLRRLVHETCPDVKETIKWGVPHFEHHGVLCSMSAFKKHCHFIFWKAALMSDPQRIFPEPGESSMGHIGQIKSLQDLPADDVLIAYIQEAIALNEAGIKARKSKPANKKELPIPDDLQQALEQNSEARQMFSSFSPSQQKEYILWITEAKTAETRGKRLDTAIEWIAEGKPRNWKYMRK